jgi:hypothetical protein
MGTWGVKLYDNDAAADARDEWLGKLRGGATERQAADELVEMLRGWNEPVAWIALADTQWTWGRLDARVLHEAERAFKAGGDLALWTDPKDREARRRVLDQVAARLTTPPPAAKSFKVDGDALNWKVGQLWAYRTLDAKWAVFRVTAIDPSYGIVPAPMFELLDVVPEGEDPAVGDLARVGLREARRGWDAGGKYAGLVAEHRASPMFEAAVKVRGERPRRRLRRIRAAGNPRPADAKTKAIGVPWQAMDDFLARTFDVGGPRPGAVVRWPLKEGGAGYAMIECGRWTDRDIEPMWQVSLLGCRGDDLDQKTLETAQVTARLLVNGFPPDGGLREVAYRPLVQVDRVMGFVYQWEHVPRKLADSVRASVGSNESMEAFLALSAKLAVQKGAKSAAAKPKKKR